MKNTIAALSFATWLLSGGLSASCASLPTVSPVPPLDQQILELSPDAPSVHFQYRECVKKFLWVCTHEELRRVEYDLTKPEVRKQLIDTGFHLVVWEKP